MTIATSQTFTHTLESRAAGRGRTERIPKTVRTLIWVAVLLALAEGGVRLRAWIRHGVAGPVANIYIEDGVLGRRLRPGATMKGTSRTVTINSFGFRGPEIALAKSPGTIRVVAIGDSTTFAMEASDDQSTWVRRMEVALNETNDASSSAARYEAMNAGVPGFTLESATTQLFGDVARFSPDVVVVTAMMADVAAHSRRQFGESAKKQGAKSSVVRWLGENSLFVNLLRQNTVAFRATQLPTAKHDRLDDGGIARYRRILASLVDRCRAGGIKPVLCTWSRAFRAGQSGNQHALAATALANNPALSLRGLNNAFDRYNDVIREVACEKNVALVDLDRAVASGANYFVDAIHLNDAGHELVGRLIAEVIQELRQKPDAGGGRF